MDDKSTDDHKTSENAHELYNFPIVVIGASAGGFEALKELVDQLPADLDAAIFVVWHMASKSYGVLPRVLNRFDKMQASHGYDCEPIKRNRIYIAPPDRHMLIEQGQIRITHGPKENRFRPAIDPLFRSAAYYYGQRVIGVVLSGALDDGTAGLWAIKHFGGVAMVQDPAEAEVKGMPENAIREVNVDHCLPVSELAAMLAKLTKGKTETADIMKMPDEKIEAELKIASDDDAFENNIMKFGELSPFACPECHGVLTMLREGNLKRFRCHTGHAFSADSLLDALTETIEESLYSAIRGVDETVMLLNHMGDHFAELNQTKQAAMFFKKASEANQRSQLMRQAVYKHKKLSQESILEQLSDTENSTKAIT